MQLLEPIQILGEVKLTEKDLQTSLTSSLLNDAFQELLVTLLVYQHVSDPRHTLDHYKIVWRRVILNKLGFELQGLITRNEVSKEIIIEGQLELISSQSLRLIFLKAEGLPELNDNSLGDLELDLGSDVMIESLKLEDNQLFCQVKLLVRP